ncbi:cytochrome b5 domain-containing protein [Methanolobus sediminis]|uniref:Cytochrome b5 domain-containing protein n=1 Tax=Methanolobus sediminis TaxID=3072978 RepID=A0AA51UJM0_9EURY|nr:cytochrome b5 domain-containing protein [Methanolobus sediminis]WMW24771.1 cytochrome b5 domain-containing protein [Methanolobus sediminis]
MQEFTLEEVARYNGIDNEKVYVVYAGQVYDVSASEFWETGEHMGLHEAGTDLTESLDMEAPHEVDALDSFPVVGKIKE